MPRFNLQLVSQEYGGETILTVQGGRWTPQTNGIFDFTREAGGSGAEEVKISTIQLAPERIVVRRNTVDGTHFRVVFGIETDQKEVPVTIQNSQGGGGTSSSFVEVRSPVDAIRHQNSGSSTQNLRLS